jgi:uncharacterized DUF497 family protein
MGKILDWVDGRRKRPALRFDGHYNRKAEIVREEHGLTLDRAETVFRDPYLYFIPARPKAGERRWFVFGETHDKLVAIVLFTIKGKGDQERIRLITTWPAGKEVREYYIRQRRFDDGNDNS